MLSALLYLIPSLLPNREGDGSMLLQNVKSDEPEVEN